MKQTVKKLLTLAGLLLCLEAKAELLVQSNASFCRFASSYFTSHRTGDYLDSAKHLYWPGLNIHCYEDSRGGAGIQEANENRLERKGLAQWANGSQFWGEIWADDNGGYDTNGVVNNVTNTFRAPLWFFNGTAYTNEGGWSASHTINWIGLGAIPYTNNFVEGCAESIRNNAMTNAAAHFAFQSVDMFHPLLVWSNDQMSGSNTLRFGTPDVTHPGPPGNLDMAIVAAQSMMDTNINTCILDYGRASVSVTQHCVVSSLSLAGSGLSFTWHADRHSMAWDEPDGTITNDASQALLKTNAFYEALVFTNVPNGTYKITEDGSNIYSATIANNSLTVNLFNVTRGAVWAQRREVLGRIRDKRGCDRVTLVDSGSLGENSYDGSATTAWNAGNRGDALISALATHISDLNTKDAPIWNAAQPTNHTFTVTPAVPVFAPFHK